MPHIHEKIDFTASVFVVNGNAVLLRKHEKYNKWLQPGGHIELDEDPNQAAVREVKEETGLDVVLHGSAPTVAEGGGDFKNLLVPAFLNLHQVKADSEHKHCDFIYFATVDTRTLNPREEETECEMRWFTREELSEPEWDLWPSTKFYAEAALDELSA